MVLGIYGAGGSGRELYEVISEENVLLDRWDDIVFIDDSKGEGNFYFRKRLPFEIFSQKYPCDMAEIVIAVGEPADRKRLAEHVKEKGYSLATIISSRSRISLTARIGEGVVITTGSTVSSNAIIDCNVWVASDAIIGHDVHVMEHCQISSMVAIAARTVIEESVFIGISACIREDLVIGHDSIIAMGAVVLKDVRENRKVIGNPAREIAENDTHRVFSSKKPRESR